MFRTQDPKVEALSSVEVFAGMSRRELREASRLMTTVRVPAGRVLCQQGARAREVFLVVDGDIEISRDDVTLGVVTAGGIVGEIALTSGGLRTATTTTLTEARVLALSTSEFYSLMHAFPAVAEKIRDLSAQRLEDGAQRTAPGAVRSSRRVVRTPVSA